MGSSDSTRRVPDMPVGSGDQPPGLDGFKFNINKITKGEKLETLVPVMKSTKIERKNNHAPPNANKTKMRFDKKRAVSDDEENYPGGYKTSKTANATREPTGIIMEDLNNIIDEAARRKRIDEKKAERLRECLQSSSWQDIALSLLCEHIPLKRNCNGYSCRVCLVPKKGHTCPYCPICSTPEKKFKKDDEHVCFNCPMCFEEGKKKKKLVQIKCGGNGCPHAPPTNHKEA